MIIVDCKKWLENNSAQISLRSDCEDIIRTAISLSLKT